MAKHTASERMKHAVFIFSEDQLGYKFSETHPFNQKRLVLTIDLLKKMNADEGKEYILL